ncbi:MAG TPA: hypothetical protein VNC80_17185 [Mycobacteriales bacterium]|nr:hypothetical protein [Mycobacteriales bacterium]
MLSVMDGIDDRRAAWLDRVDRNAASIDRLPAARPLDEPAVR